MHICLEFSSEGYKLISPSTLVSCITSTASSRYSTACFQCVSGLNGDVESTRAFSSAGKVTVNHTQKAWMEDEPKHRQLNTPLTSLSCSSVTVFKSSSANLHGWESTSSTVTGIHSDVFVHDALPGKVGHAGHVHAVLSFDGAPEIQSALHHQIVYGSDCKIRPGR